GAHNQESMSALCTSIKESFSFERCICVLGMHQDKDLPGILSALLPSVDRLGCTRSTSLRAMPSDAIRSSASALGYNGFRTNSISEAMELALGLAHPQDVVCVTGSLAVVAEARELLMSTRAKDN